jgi:hypothetical protein
MLKELNIKLEDIDIEKEALFKQKFNEFINEEKDNNNHNIMLDESFKNLKEKLMKMKKNCPKKLFWIFYWYIKWQKEFVVDKYIIIQNLEYNIKSPSIIDIKLGNEKKISKETGKVKIFKGAHESLGCRIMGISSNNLYFKSRYETKELKENEFIEELYNFFVNKKNIINSIINELQEIIKFVQNHFCMKIFFCSLLIFYDNSEDNNNAIVNLIDFDLTNNTTITNDYNCLTNKENKNNILIKNNQNKGFINCMNNLISVIKNINK